MTGPSMTGVFGCGSFKETQLVHVHIGNYAEVTVDAVPNQMFEGVVEGTRPNSSATFSLTTPSNATSDHHIRVVYTGTYPVRGAL